MTKDENRKEHYSRKGMYTGYDKNHKERAANDFYSTPREEVTNILEALKIDFNDSIILEPCAGGGHMLMGIKDYLDAHNQKPRQIRATDIQCWNKCEGITDDNIIVNGEYTDFLSDNYMFNADIVSEPIDYIIMNPPFTIVEAFAMKALSIAQKGVVMFGRIQFLEGEKRFNAILKDFPPTDVYGYVDRIACYKNGNTNEKMASAQMYAWYYWDFMDFTKEGTKYHWIRRVDKQ